jgi:hypothetical protein
VHAFLVSKRVFRSLGSGGEGGELLLVMVFVNFEIFIIVGRLGSR